MSTARIFKSGNSQAVRLPKEFRFGTEEVEIYRRGNEVVLRRRPTSATEIFDLIASLPKGFLAEKRKDALPQKRESF